MNVSVHILAYNEAEMLVWTLRHYAQFCSQIIVEDLGSSDGTQELAREAGAEIVQHDCKAEFNDMQNKTIKNTCWHGTRADWVICADADELLHFPSGAESTLALYDHQNIPVVNPFGFEMHSDVPPGGEGQITHKIKHGARDDYWYGKKVMFSPKRVASVDFGTGAHVTNATLHDGRKILVDSKSPPSVPGCYLLHFHHIWGLERSVARYEAVIARLSAENKQHRWGVQSDARGHAMQKRTSIISKLERVLP